MANPGQSVLIKLVHASPTETYPAWIIAAAAAKQQLEAALSRIDAKTAKVGTPC